MSDQAVPTLDEINAYFATAFNAGGQVSPRITYIARDEGILHLDIQDYHLRPGGYISGPTQMTLADQAAYIAIFTRIGIAPMAVTSNLSIDFLRPCLGDVLEVKAKLIKLGRTLAVIHVEIRGVEAGKGQSKMASHAVVSYALPKE